MGRDTIRQEMLGFERMASAREVFRNPLHREEVASRHQRRDFRTIQPSGSRQAYRSERERITPSM
jgi:hypothetical protein